MAESNGCIRQNPQYPTHGLSENMKVSTDLAPQALQIDCGVTS
jgi:hypothetical protein